MRTYLLTIALFFAASSAIAQSSLTAAGGESEGVAWSIEGVVSAEFGDAAGTVVEGFVPAAVDAQGGVEAVAAPGRAVTVFPNPVANTLTLRPLGRGEFVWSLTSLGGKLAMEGKGSGGSAAVDCSGLAPGAYVVTIGAGNEKCSTIIIKK